MRTSGSGSRPPTIADVARLAEVSRTTVSHALNGIGKVDPRTRERIKQVAAELGYRPNLRAQRLRRGEAKAIALASSMPFAVAGGPSRLGFYMEIAAATAESALLHGYALVLVPPVQSGSALYSVDIDGAIVVEPDVNDAAAAQLRERGLPYVSLGRPVSPDDTSPYVDLRGGPVRPRTEGQSDVAKSIWPPVRGGPSTVVKSCDGRGAASGIRPPGTASGVRHPGCGALADRTAGARKATVRRRSWKALGRASAPGGPLTSMVATTNFP